MILTNQDRHPIRSLEEWLQYAPPPKGEKHWKDGRSAKELAKAWMTYNGPSMPSELMDLLGTHSNTAGFQAEWAVPEYETKMGIL